jgi:hypothetical protein
MKKLKLSIVLLSMLAVAACKKTSDNASENATITTDDAADIITNSLADNTNGIADVTGDITLDANTITGYSVNGKVINSLGTASLECGATKTSTVTRKSEDGKSPAYNYTASYSSTLNCNANNQPDNLTTTGTFSGSWNGAHLTSSSQGSLNLKVAGLTNTALNYVANGEYKRSGSYQAKPDTTKAGSTSIDLVVKDLTIAKEGKKIASGTATVTLTGTTKKGSFSYTGTLVFTGNQKALLSIEGKNYTIDLDLGIKIKV